MVEKTLERSTCDTKIRPEHNMTPVLGSKCLKAMKGINQGGCIVCEMHKMNKKVRQRI
jgi:hypothetical protein